MIQPTTGGPGGATVVIPGSGSGSATGTPTRTTTGTTRPTTPGRGTVAGRGSSGALVLGPEINGPLPGAEARRAVRGGALPFTGVEQLPLELATGGLLVALGAGMRRLGRKRA